MKEIVYISKKKGLYIMNVYDKVLEYAEESEDIKCFNKKIKRSYQERKDVLAQLIKNEIDNDSFSSKDKHAIKLFIYPCDYGMTVDAITRQFFEKHLDELMSAYAERKIEYIKSLNRIYFKDSEKEEMIQSIKKEEKKSLYGIYRKNFVHYFSEQIDKMLYSDFGV
jgi:hypothetical protein